MKPALAQWGRAILMLEQQNGHIDAAFLRRLLTDSFEEEEIEMSAAGPHSPFRRQALRSDPVVPLGGCLLVEVLASHPVLPLAWWAFGPPSQSIFIPIPLLGEIPGSLLGSPDAGRDNLAGRLSTLFRAAAVDRKMAATIRTELENLQGVFETDAANWLAEAVASGNNPDDLHLLGGQFLQRVWRRFTEATDGLLQAMRFEHGMAAW